MGGQQVVRSVAETEVSAQQHQSFSAEVGLSLQHHASAFGEIHRPEAAARLLRHQQSHPLVRFRCQFGAEEALFVLITEFPNQFGGRNQVVTSQRPFHKLQQHSLQGHPLQAIYMQFAVGQFVVVMEAGVEVVPVIQSDPFLRVGLEYLNLSVGASQQHSDVIVLAVSNQSLQSAVLGLHQHEVASLCGGEEITLAQPLTLPVDLSLALAQTQFAGGLVAGDYLADGVGPLLGELWGVGAEEDGVGGFAEAEGELGEFVVGLAGQEFETEAALELLAGFIEVEVEFLGCEAAEVGLPGGEQSLALSFQRSAADISFLVNGFHPILALGFGIEMGGCFPHLVIHLGFILPEGFQIIIIGIHFGTSFSPMVLLAAVGVGAFPIRRFPLSLRSSVVLLGWCFQGLHVARIYQFHIKRGELDQCYPLLNLLISNNSPAAHYLIMPELRYKWRDLKGDVVAGGLNGSIFGLIYSFYFLPVDRLDPKVFATCRNSRGLYTLMNVAKMAAGFAIMRSTYNGIKKQELGQTYEMAGCATAFGLICTFM